MILMRPYLMIYKSILMEGMNKMQYLLDTHVILWWFTNPEKIHAKARKIIKDKSNRIFLSAISFWEMAIKKGLGRLTLPHNLIETATIEGFSILPITAEETIGVSDLPLIHNDLFDKLLIIQAKMHDLVIITRDMQIQEYPVVCVKA